jgi:hypothetical protein
MLTEHQFGFRRGHSTKHACISIADYVYESLDRNHVCFIISLDIMKAFDTIDRDILIQKLAWYGIRSNLIWSFINDCDQFVSIVKSESTLSSSLKKTILGLAQGSSLSNLLFAVMINDLVCRVKNCKVKLYADDTNLYISGPLEDVQLLISMIEIDLVAITQWMDDNRLKLNVGKTTLLIVARQNMLKYLSSVEVKINGCAIVRVKSMKILGVLFDENFCWSEHMKKVKIKCNLTLRSLYPLKSVLSVMSKRLIIPALVLSHINYACVVWLKSNLFKECDLLIKRCARYVFGFSKFDSVSDLICDDLKWLFSKYLVQENILKLSYKILNGIAPLYFRNYLTTETVPGTQTRSRQYTIPAIPIASNFGNRSFRYCGSKEITELPSSINVQSSYTVFKTLTHEFIVNCQRAEVFIRSANHDGCDLSCVDYVINNLSTFLI